MADFNWIWKAVLMVIVGTFLLRIAGRKSIAQMTLAQTVLMIAIGSLLIQPVSGKNLWVTFGVGAVLVVTLIAMEFGQLKSDSIEKFITGKSVPLIENGTLNEKNLSHLRLTVDQLEMKLRQKNIKKVSHVKWATLEPNGQLGYELKQDYQPALKKDLQSLATDISELKEALNHLLNDDDLLTELNQKLNRMNQTLAQSSDQSDIFKEVQQKGHNDTPPKRLQ
ncbi:DUF421 domain-containing protein [Tuberibacillus sp. Marseille-P3662]|uniref:DUF421 domain-containing protein n=1 Tax=Tuberibacillus sp. Marseille-P3662 TaxID=1965358 RepID=UPI000A1CAC90|nr:DUF421 domain-containing protein [Tuberibacillus sp. Marseille-P3662]